METIPTDVISYAILGKNSLEDIYAYCLSSRHHPDWANQCNKAEFWRRLGKSKYPHLSETIADRRGSIGLIYRSLAEFLYEISQHLFVNDSLIIVIPNIMTDAMNPYLLEVIDPWWLQTTNKITLEIEIMRLYNGRYLINTSDVSKLDDPDTNQSMSIDEFINYLVGLLYLSSGSILIQQEEPGLITAAEKLASSLAPVV